ncbi:hypothetical protein Agub_g11232, partial [Astrephomene gubernaculifera]
KGGEESGEGSEEEEGGMEGEGEEEVEVVEISSGDEGSGSEEEIEDSDEDYSPGHSSSGDEEEEGARGQRSEEDEDEEDEAEDDVVEVADSDEEEGSEGSGGRAVGRKRKRSGRSGAGGGGRGGGKAQKRSKTGNAGGKGGAAGMLASLSSKSLDEQMTQLREAVRTYSELRSSYVALVRQRKSEEHQLAAVTQRLQKQELHMKALCAVARNNFSRDRLQQDFREGVKEMGKLPTGGPEGEGEPELPVFCVSARDAQKLEGRNKRAGRAATFVRLDQTEVLALRQHVRHTAERGRMRAQRELLRALFAFIDSVGSFLLNKRQEDPRVSAAVLRAVFGQGLEWLRARLQEGLDVQLLHIQDEFLHRGLRPYLLAGLAEAQGRAPGTSRGWGLRNWSTYRACVRRNGVFHSPSAGPLDFNGDLANPLLNRIGGVWDDIFNKRFAQRLSDLVSWSLEVLDSFVAAVRQQVAQRLAGCPQQLDSLHAQVRRDEERRLAAWRDRALAEVEGAARDLSRDVMEPRVRAALQPAYQQAAWESGTGCYKRMKAAVEGRVEAVGAAALREAAAALEQEVAQLLSRVGASFAAALETLVEAATARFSLLWDDAPSSYDHRYPAAVALRDLACRTRDMCGKAGVAVPEPFELPPPTPEEPVGVRAAAGVE